MTKDEIDAGCSYIQSGLDDSPRLLLTRTVVEGGVRVSSGLNSCAEAVSVRGPGPVNESELHQVFVI